MGDLRWQTGSWERSFNKLVFVQLFFCAQCLQQWYCFTFLICAPHFFLAGSAYRECMENGTWALKSNYSNCEPILEEKVSVATQERSLYALHSAHNLLIISDKCSSQPHHYSNGTWGETIQMYGKPTCSVLISSSFIELHFILNTFCFKATEQNA